MTALGARWRLVPHFLLRRAGFPCDLVGDLGAPSLNAAALEVVALRDRAEVARAELLARFPAEVEAAWAREDREALAALSKWRKAVGRRRPDEAPPGRGSPGLLAADEAWNTAQREAASAERALAELVEREILASRQLLREICRRSEVREALFLLCPGLLETRERLLDAAPSADPRSGERALERRLYAYVQRFATKNETTSFFGPITYGTVQVAEGQDGELSLGPERARGVTRGEVFAAFWAVSAFADAISADPAVRPHLPVRRLSTFAPSASGARAADGREVRLDAVVGRVYLAVDDRSDPAALAARTGDPLGEVELALQRLERAGLVRQDLEPSSTRPRPLDELLERLPSVPAAEPWRRTLAAFRAGCEQFAAAPLDERRALFADLERLFTEATGKPARRGEGEMYADRSLLYEDCLGDLHPVHLSPAGAERLEQALHPVLSLAAAFGELEARAVRALAAEVLVEREGRMPFFVFAQELDRRAATGRLEALRAPVRAFVERLEALVRERFDGEEAQLSPDELAALLPGGVTGRFSSPDVMLEQDEAGGPLRYVLGELHPYVFAWGSQGLFHPEPDPMLATFSEDLGPWGGRERMATVLRRRKHKGLVSEVFPGRFVEVTGRSSDDPARRIPLAELEVELEQGLPVLRHGGQSLVLYSGEQDHLHLQALSPSAVRLPRIRVGEEVPRIVVGPMLVQRRGWRVEPDSVPAGAPAEVAISIARLRARGLPRFVFALSDAEPKPICLDLAAPFSWDLLRGLLDRGPVHLSEMRPAPDRLWLERSAGRFTSELRLALLREP